MAKTITANQTIKIDRPWVQPVYLVNIFLADLTQLRFSDRYYTFTTPAGLKYNFEDYLHDLPGTIQQIERFGGYQNLSAQFVFKNEPYRGYASLLEYFDAFPVTRQVFEIYVLYFDTIAETFAGTEPTLLIKSYIGEFTNINKLTFTAELMSVLHYLDSKNPFTQINTTTWPNAEPKVIGNYENIVYGSLMQVPCHCVTTGAITTLFADLTAGATTITLSNSTYPISFPASGTVQIDSEKITYTGKGTNTLTGCTRGTGGTAAAVHTRGAPVWEILATYKYLVSGHVSKAINAVYGGPSKIRVDPANYTATLNDSGKSTIAFTTAQFSLLLEAIASSPTITVDEGSHDHTVFSTSTVIASSGSMGGSTGHGFAVLGTEDLFRDQSDETYAGASHVNPDVTGWYAFAATFAAWGGPTPSQIFLCITQSSQVSANSTARIAALGQGFDVYSEATKVTQKFVITGTTVPTSVTFTLTVNSTTNGTVQGDVYEMWLEVKSQGTSSDPAAGVSATISAISAAASANDVVAPLLFADVDGYADDVSGTYTGDPSSLISNPSDVRRHLLIAVLGIAAGYIDTTTFNAIRTTYAGLSYAFGFILSRLGSLPSEVFTSLDFQSRSQMREDGGEFLLTFNSLADPASVLTITNVKPMDNLIGDPVFGQTRAEDIKNTIRAVYDYDWSGINEKDRWKFGEYKKQLSLNNADSVTKYGALVEDIEFPAVQSATMADDVVDWILVQKHDVLKTVQLTVDWSARILERGDYFTLTYDFWTGLKWRVLEIQEIPEKQQFSISAIQYIGS